MYLINFFCTKYNINVTTQERCKKISLIFFVRYWLFCDVIPGLYIEKGWVHESINYSYTLPLEEKLSEQEDEEEDDGERCVPQS